MLDRELEAIGEKLLININNKIADAQKKAITSEITRSYLTDEMWEELCDQKGWKDYDTWEEGVKKILRENNK